MVAALKRKKRPRVSKKSTRHVADYGGRHADGRKPATKKAETGQGELAITLLKRFDAGLYFVGRIRTPWKRHQDCPKNSRESDDTCMIEVDERYSAALVGVENCTHLIVLYWMHQARRDLVLQRPRRYLQHLGAFALRSPIRPNPIAASVVKVCAVEGSRVSVVGLDCVDGTPLIDLKPYFASTDAVPEAVVGWHAKSDQTYVALRDLLRSGEFASGCVLPEARLATQLNVSRAPLREGMLRLTCEGLLETAGANFAQPKLSRADVNEIYELRLLLEPEAARQVARIPHGRRWLKALREYLAAMVEAQPAGDADAFIDANDGYRATWLERVPNQRLLRTIELYADHVRYLRLFTLGDRSTRRVVVKGLKRLTAAFAAARPEVAAAVLRDHLGAAKQALLETLELADGDRRHGA
jgi:tRNA-Thr(GGU) m(6)t(6)A37 methyltransferase TsaA